MNSPKAGFRDVWSLGNDEPQERKVVCEVGPSDTLFADAELIAAAPDLLEACKAVEEWARTGQDHGGNPYFKKFVKLSMAAVEKAQGTL
jgi:hypothetical protein